MRDEIIGEAFRMGAFFISCKDTGIQLYLHLYFNMRAITVLVLPTEVDKSVAAQANFPAMDIPNCEAIQLGSHFIHLRKSITRGR